MVWPGNLKRRAFSRKLTRQKSLRLWFSCLDLLQIVFWVPMLRNKCESLLWWYLLMDKTLIYTGSFPTNTTNETKPGTNSFTDIWNTYRGVVKTWRQRKYQNALRSVYKNAPRIEISYDLSNNWRKSIKTLSLCQNNHHHRYSLVQYWMAKWEKFVFKEKTVECCACLYLVVWNLF